MQEWISIQLKIPFSLSASTCAVHADRCCAQAEDHGEYARYSLKKTDRLLYWYPDYVFDYVLKLWYC